MANKKILCMLWMFCILGPVLNENSDCLPPHTTMTMEIRVYFGMTGDKSCEITLNSEMAHRYNSFIQSDEQKLTDKDILYYIVQQLRQQLPIQPELNETSEKNKFKLTYKDHGKNHFVKADQGLRLIPSSNQGCFVITVDDNKKEPEKRRIFFNLRGEKQLILYIDTSGATEIGFYTCIQDLSSSKVEVITTSSREGTLGIQWANSSIFDLLCKFKEDNLIIDSETLQ